MKKAKVVRRRKAADVPVIQIGPFAGMTAIQVAGLSPEQIAAMSSGGVAPAIPSGSTPATAKATPALPTKRPASMDVETGLLVPVLKGDTYEKSGEVQKQKTSGIRFIPRRADGSTGFGVKLTAGGLAVLRAVITNEANLRKLRHMIDVLID